MTTVTKKMSVTTEKVIAISREALITLLNNSDVSDDGIPENASIWIKVPNGGDYSGMTLDISNDCPVFVKWKTSEDVNA